ncbi:hypothetical protein [Palleronia sp. LCG004]|uniref:hypothetical protein n=1 Tax=Palleronia sp. LCG004 TaxID=3079304 RepID=UPI002941C9C7|nr:hypothetical protein [Palleronia sp. LCG004]WOI54963.1 hypothetical protein RVY76_07750 [Palleronia sp. LCG004]
MEKVILQFTRAHGPYNAGDKAGFDPVTAVKIEAQGVAQRYKPEAEGVVAEPAGQGTDPDPDPATDAGQATAKKDGTPDATPSTDAQKTAKQAALPSQGKK